MTTDHRSFFIAESGGILDLSLPHSPPMLSCPVRMQIPPPMLSGLPVLGCALEFRRDPLTLFRRGYAAHGPVFGIKLLFQPAVVLVGPEKMRFFFEDTDRTLSMSEV